MTTSRPVGPSACCEDEVSANEMISTFAAAISCGLTEKQLGEWGAHGRQRNHRNFSIVGDVVSHTHLLPSRSFPPRAEIKRGREEREIRSSEGAKDPETAIFEYQTCCIADSLDQAFKDVSLFTCHICSIRADIWWPNIILDALHMLWRDITSICAVSLWFGRLFLNICPIHVSDTRKNCKVAYHLIFRKVNEELKMH